MSRSFLPRMKPVKMTFFEMPRLAASSMSSLRSSPSPAKTKRSFGFFVTARAAACMKCQRPFWMVKRPTVETMV